jgi:mRNA interferase MazF
MAITFVPDAGTVLMCDFTGFIPPEMTKIRHVVVISPRGRTVNIKNGTCLVVPFSTAGPLRLEPYHVLMPAGVYPFFKAEIEVWAKTNLVSHVSFARLDRVIVGGRHAHAELNPADFGRIKQGVLHAMGLGHLTAGV